MAAPKTESFPIVEPSLQISFYYKLRTIKELYLQDALKATLKDIDLRRLDQELNDYVDSKYLRRVASFGIRGEVLFPVPYVIEKNPFLLGYYRLLYGLSQKEFYGRGPFGRFKRLEESGEISSKRIDDLPLLCKSLVETAILLVKNIDDWSLSDIHEMQLLTVGPQLRGGENVRKGQEATKEVFSFIRDIVKPYIRHAKDRTILIENDSGRKVLIEFSSDPDISIIETLKSRNEPLVSIEIKGGTDFSNIHNRLGEAEKSHLKASRLGFFEFWTLLRVDIAESEARKASPTTSHFFNIDRLLSAKTDDNTKFIDLLGSKLGIGI